MVLLIYAFLFQVVLVVVRDLRKGTVREPSSQAQRVHLVVVDAGSDTIFPGQTFELEPITRIGRSSSSTITLSDSYVSSEHTLVAFRDGQWWVEDLGSTNGTHVNRREITGPTPVNFGDIIEIGRTRMKLAR